MTDKKISLEEFSETDVISFDSGQHTVRMDKFVHQFEHRFRNHRDALSPHNILENRNHQIVGGQGHNQWFQEGKPCEILTMGARQWKKGRFRVTLSLEFIPDDEPEEVDELNHFREASNVPEESNWPPQ